MAIEALYLKLCWAWPHSLSDSSHTRTPKSDVNALPTIRSRRKKREEEEYVAGTEEDCIPEEGEAWITFLRRRLQRTTTLLLKGTRDCNSVLHHFYSLFLNKHLHRILSYDESIRDAVEEIEFKLEPGLWIQSRTWLRRRLLAVAIDLKWSRRGRRVLKRIDSWTCLFRSFFFFLDDTISRFTHEYIARCIHRYCSPPSSRTKKKIKQAELLFTVLDIWDCIVRTT